MNSSPMARGRVVVDGGAHPLGESPRLTLGREPDNDIVVNHPLVSRRHLAIEWRGSAWYLVDLGSTNGFFAGGQRVPEFAVSGPTRVRLGDATTGPVLDVALDPAGHRPPGSVPHTPAPPGAFPSGPRSAGFAGPGSAPLSGRMPAAMSPGGPPRPAAPAPMPPELRSAPHLQSLQQNVSAVYRLPGAPTPPEREPISLHGVQRIGRTPDNDIVVSDVLASRHHARVSTRGGMLVIEDLGSVNGTFVNGHRVASAPLNEGDVVTIGNSDFVVSAGTLIRGQERAAVADGLHVHGVSLVVDGGKRLLADVDFSAGPGTLTAVIGPSGAGKSTVSKIVAGLNSPTSGLVTFESRNVHAEYEALRTRIGMVPQKDVLHHKLTLRQALRYAAELRLPPDLSTADRDRVIDGVLGELQLTEHVDTRVEKLSGGQQKRASVAMELLTGPSLLILDEPTSGLDPALDRQVMATLRRLADAGRVVLVVTHSLTYLSMCDQVLLLAPGGKTSFCGPPSQVEQEMGTSDWAEIFAYVADQPDAAHTRYLQRHRRSQAPPPAQRPPGPPIPVPHTSFPRQASTIARRQVRLVFADVGYLVFLVLLPVVLGLLTLVIPGSSGFARLEVIPNAPPPKDGAEAIQILVVLVARGVHGSGADGARPGGRARHLRTRESRRAAARCLPLRQGRGVLRRRGAADGHHGRHHLRRPGAARVRRAGAAAAVGAAGRGRCARLREHPGGPGHLVGGEVQRAGDAAAGHRGDGATGVLWRPLQARRRGAATAVVDLPVVLGLRGARRAVDLHDINPAAPQRISLWDTSVAHSALAYAVLAVISVLLLAFTYSRLRLKKR